MRRLTVNWPASSSALWAVYLVVAAAVILVLIQNGVHAFGTNGFDLNGSLIPREEIHHGGPPRDGIPSIDRPRFITADQAAFLNENDRVLGVDRNGITKAYPIRILDYHEIVNDEFGEESVVVSYCPLCGTGMAFSAEAAGQRHTFGVSGLLYNSDVLLYDRSTESLWSQIMRKAVSGELKGTSLEQLPLTHTTWRDWRRRHPSSLVLSIDTGYPRNYARSPYAGYDESSNIWFPVSSINRRYHPKELVIGLIIADRTKVYPFAELSKMAANFNDRFAGQVLQIQFDARNRSGRVLNQHGEELPSTVAFWFAWIAFHPNAEVFTAPAR